MKKLLGKVTALALVALMAFSVLSITKVNAASYNGEVTFVIEGQEKKVQINSGDETISGTDRRGAPVERGSTLTKEYFIGWSTNKEYATTDGSKFFYGNQKISEILPDGIKPEVKIYPIYFSRTSVMTYFAKKNTININYNKSASETVKTG